MIQSPYTELGGGLDLSASPMTVNPSNALLAVNYECDKNGNFRSIGGYSQLGGGAVTGTGEILGVAVFDGEYYAVREDSGVAKLYKENAGSWSYIAPSAGSLPVGKYHFAIAPFSAVSTDNKLFLLCEGSGKPWVYNGTTLSEISAAPSGTSYMCIHNEHLFLANAIGSVVHSKLGDYTDWVNGSEIGVSAEITGMTSTTGGVLCIFCTDQIKNLYGNDKNDWELRKYSNTSVRANSNQAVGATAVFLSDSGMTGLESSQNYGDFSLATWGRTIDVLFDSNPVPESSCVLSSEDQYWCFFENGLGLIARQLKSGGMAFTTTDLPNTIVACASGKVSGEDKLIMGDDSGSVYLYSDDDTSFAGSAINTLFATSFNHFKSPTLVKKYRRLYLNIQAETSKEITVLPQFDWAEDDNARHLLLYRNALAEGGLWDVATWDNFAWSSPLVDQGKVDIAGSGVALNLVINTTSTTAGRHTLLGYTTHFEPRRHIRG